MPKSEQPGGSPSSQTKETAYPSVICPYCKELCVVPSIKFDKDLNDRLECSVNPIGENDKEPTFLIAYKESVEKKYTYPVQCESCKNMIDLNVNLFREFGQSESKTKLSFKTLEKKEKQKNPGKDFSLRPLHRVKVFYFCTGEAFGADHEIKKQLKEDTRLSLLVEETTQNDSYIIIVFCPITSRVGSDVESTMRDLPVSSLDKPVILVVMHHTRDPEYSTGGTNWSEVYKNVVLYVHILFHETMQGLLKCRQNSKVIKIIQEELKKYSKSWVTVQNLPQLSM